VFREDEADKADPVLAKRWGASKRTRLIVPEKKEAEEKKDDLDWAALANAMAQEARNVRTEQAARIVGVIANRVRTARMIFDILKGENGDEAILLIGRARAWDRDRIWTQWKEKIGLDGKQRQDGLVFVVATQCIEVGANIDFDGLVTEIASVDALEQRFGRLNRGGRDGECHAAVVALKEQTAAKYDDAIYGKAMTATWAWLGKQAVALTEVKRKTKAKKFVEMGVLALRGALERTENRAELTCPRVSAPVLMPAHMDLLCQTSPEPALTPEPAVFLHGPQSEPEDVQIVWRRDLATDPATWIDTVAICPPSAAEAISMPVWSVRQWLLKKPAPDVADIEGASAPPDIRDKPGGGPTLWWRGAEKSVQLKSASAVKPGMLLVVPSTYGGCDDWGWNPDFEEPVRDVGDAVKLRLGKPMLRLDAALAEQWKYGDLARDLRGCDGVKEAKLLLKGWGGIPADPWVTDAVKRLADSRLKLVDDSQSDAEEQVAIAARGKVSRDGVEAPLDEHLAGCREWAAGYSLELPERLRATVARAAALHDIGKADPRFQAWLRGGNPVKPNELIAKSKSSPLNPAGIRKARELAGYPEGGRHELMSSAMVSTRIAEETDVDRDLLLHLIGSHHGMCRPFAPIIEDSAPVTVSYAGWSAESDHCLERLGSGVSARFWALTRKYGWYGLAYLEALVRLSDYKQSSEEQTSASRKAEAAHV
jgi:CRISPR-associated endonuclease/helicase Cas3